MERGTTKAGMGSGGGLVGNQSLRGLGWGAEPYRRRWGQVRPGTRLRVDDNRGDVVRAVNVRILNGDCWRMAE